MASVVGAVLGPEHAVAQMLRAAADANLSAATRTALRERERIRQVPEPLHIMLPHANCVAVSEHSCCAQPTGSALTLSTSSLFSSL